MGIVLLLIHSVSFAENSLDIDPQKIIQANADISQIKIEFCNKPGQYTIKYKIAPGETQDICFKASNSSSKDMEVAMWFVDGTVTNDGQKNKACKQQWEDEKFWQYVTWFTSFFTIPANDTVVSHAKIALPLSSKGKIKWCLIYYTKSTPVKGKMGLSILIRKAKFIDIQVRENSVIKKYIIGIVSILLLIYYIRIFLFRKKTKKPPQR